MCTELPLIWYLFLFLKLHFLLVICQQYVVFFCTAAIWWCGTFISLFFSKSNFSFHFSRRLIVFLLELIYFLFLFVLKVGLVKKQNSWVQYTPVFKLMSQLAFPVSWQSVAMLMKYAHMEEICIFGIIRIIRLYPKVSCWVTLYDFLRFINTHQSWYGRKMSK